MGHSGARDAETNPLTGKRPCTPRSGPRLSGVDRQNRIREGGSFTDRLTVKGCCPRHGRGWDRTEAGGRAREEPGTRRWLHDKYERLAAQEGDLAASRTSYFAAIGTVLITGLVVALNYFLAEPRLLLAVATFLGGLGIVISFTWVVLLHRTLDAQALWRESAEQVERLLPPIEGQLPGRITLRSGATIEVDLLRPFTAHSRRFSRDEGISWMDRLHPGTLSEVLPLCFLGLWCGVLVVAWVLVPY